ncbi:MAG TPA: hypothetical protein EYG79_04045 [Rhodobacteraceae bacterium]|nr:hypothetical protein [Paracoccaceae bacterium]
MNKQNWLDKLNPDEKLLWHGKPVGRYVMTRFDQVFSGLMALGIVVGLGLLMYDITLGRSSDLPRGPATCLLFLTIGAGLQFGTRYEHKYAFYALTNERAFVGMRWFFMWNRIRVYEITPHMNIQFNHRDPATILFARDRARKTVNTGVGFRNIADGEEVHKFMLFAKKYA